MKPTMDLKIIGERIRLARERLGISQEELAMRIGKTQNAVSTYENGTRGIHISELPVLAEALGVPIAYFFGDLNPVEELESIYGRLPQKARGMLIEYGYMLERQFN